MSILADENKEIEFWRKSPAEKPGNELTIENIANKMSEADALLEKLGLYEDMFSGASSILEIGSGQGWAACILKRKFRDKAIFASDIAHPALLSARHWEKMLNINLDGAFAARSYDISVADQVFDLVYAFASAHHFRRHRRTLREIGRVLRQGGKALYMYEPGCSPFWYKSNYKRINNSRPEAPEDYLIFPQLEKLAREEGFECEVHARLAGRDRDPIKAVYYKMMNSFRHGKYIFPRCNVDMIFTKL